MWSDTLQIEILALFAEAQRSIDRRRYRAEARAIVVTEWRRASRRERLAIRRRLRAQEHRERLAARRAAYAASRGSSAYEAILGRARARAAAWYAALSPEQRSERARAQTSQRQRRRQARIGQPLCEECGGLVELARKGPAPRFCGSACWARSYRRRRKRAKP